MKNVLITFRFLLNGVYMYGFVCSMIRNTSLLTQYMIGFFQAPYLCGRFGAISILRNRCQGESQKRATELKLSLEVALLVGLMKRKTVFLMGLLIFCTRPRIGAKNYQKYYQKPSYLLKEPLQFTKGKVWKTDQISSQISLEDKVWNRKSTKPSGKLFCVSSIPRVDLLRD